MTQLDFPAARFIREIGRGKDGARSMSQADACDLYGAMLDGRVSDLEMGAIILALRVKGESVAELAGFLQAAHARLVPIVAPDGEFAPVLIPSYNGARKMANLTPLLAVLLARRGVPVLLHGVSSDPGRVTSAEVIHALGIPEVQQQIHMHANWQHHLPAFMNIAHLAPQMARLLALRRILGVRGSTHTLVKILQPFACPALRLTSYTHPEYRVLLSEYFATPDAIALGDAILMRATEGETVANVRRAQEMAWFCEGQMQGLVEKEELAATDPDLPSAADADTTARWIDDILCEQRAVPAAIAVQVEHCVQVARALRARALANLANVAND